MQTRFFRRLTALLLSLILLLAMLPAARGDVAPAAAPLSQSGEKNGMVRVYLASLNNPAVLHITVDGSYSVNGNASDVLSRGSKIEVYFNASTGKLQLQNGGETRNMGSSFTLRRHRTDGDNGLRIRESYSEKNLYPGDLEFIVKKSGNAYKLYPIVHAYMEDYLMGVIPYEMGNANPLEALKAQTVTARTYAMRAMKGSASRDYDLVDTTSDQVYRGTPTGNSRCRQAIDETRGIVSMHGSNLTGTFYTASNGGQIESPRNLWGGSGYEYIVVKDDPYDLANPGSRVHSFTVNTTGNQGNAVLQQLLNKKAQSLAGDSAKVVGVSAVTPHTPKYAAPSRLYTKLDFKVFIQADGAVRSLTLTFDIFDELEQPLSMSHSSMKNELWTVKQTDNGFLVEARRWGHGTGMSQRGAMQMANLGYSYRQIMNFYFEGCTLTQYTLTQSILSPIGSDKIQEEITTETAAPIPDETDGPADDQLLARVTTEKGTLNLRAGASTSHRVLTAIPRHQVIAVEAVEGDWCKTSYNGHEGYVMKSFLTFINTLEATPSPAPELPDDQLTARVTTQQGTLNLRAGASTSHRVLLTIPRNQVIPILEQGDTWCRTEYQGKTGYVMTKFLTILKSEQAPTHQPTENVTEKPTEKPEDNTRVYGKVTTKQGSLNLRESKSSSAKVLTTIPRHQVIPLTEVGTIWCRTSYDGYDGYVMTSFLTITVQEDQDESGLIAIAQVTTEKGTLNLRSDPRSGARVLRTIPRHAWVNVYDMDDDWCAVTYEGTPGYVMTKFLTIDKDSMVTAKPTEKPTETPTEKPTEAPTETPTDKPTQKPDQNEEEQLTTLETPVFAQINSNADTLNMRKGPGKTYDIVYDLPKGDFVMVTAMGENWCQVIYEGREGYCMREFLILPDGH